MGMGPALYLYWLDMEPALGAEVLDRALSQDAAGVADPALARATWVLAEVSEHVGRYERAEVLAEAAFTMAVEAGELAVAAQARKVAAACAVAHGERGGLPRALRMIDEARALAEASGDPLAIAFVIHDCGGILCQSGDIEERARRISKPACSSVGWEAVWAWSRWR